MIKIENTEVLGWKHAIRGMRNPMNSWDKSDSGIIDETIEPFHVGYNDLDLMKRLVNAGSDHRKFMRMIVVYTDIVAPLYWWKEFDTYKVGTVRNSCSTMHKIHSKKFTIDDFSCENLESYYLDHFKDTIRLLNDARKMYLYEKEQTEHLVTPKDYWWQLIQMLPSSYNQRSTVMLNYEVLANMYHSRKNHKLDEWKEFCRWIETLPYSELITGSEDKQ